MKNSLLVVCLLLSAIISTQAQKFRGADKSAMDMAFYPDNYAHDHKTIGDGKALIRVLYSRPARNGREVFGKLVPYGKVWRTGANENTEIKFYKDATIQGKKVKAGTYSLFTIPGETEWTIILNSDLDYWGAFSYNEANDVLRVKVPSIKLTEPLEVFSIRMAKGEADNAIMSMGWDTTAVDVPVSF